MKLNQVKESLPVLMKHNIVPFIWGAQGVGKTQSVSQVAKDKGLGFVHLHLATQEVGDLVGLLVHNADGTVKHARPEWFPTDDKGILFLDELNRAHPDVIQAMFSLITSRTIHTHKLPEGWAIVAAGNYQSDEFTVTDTSDRAWMSRFCHIKFEPSVQEFINYAESRKAVDVADFITEHAESLESKNQKSPDLAITPDRRSWLEMIAKLDTEDMDKALRMELYSGIIGQSIAAQYVTFRDRTDRRVKLRDILIDYPKVSSRIRKLNSGKETRFDLLNAPLQEFLDKASKEFMELTESEIDNLGKFLLDLPLELLSQNLKAIGKVRFTGKDQLFNNAKFTERLMR